MSEKKYNKVVAETVDHFSDLILDWSESEFGSFDKWVALLKNIMIYLTQHNPSMTEIEKTDFSVKIVVELCLILYNKYTDNETELSDNDEEDYSFYEGLFGDFSSGLDDCNAYEGATQSVYWTDGIMIIRVKKSGKWMYSTIEH